MLRSDSDEASRITEQFVGEVKTLSSESEIMMQLNKTHKVVLLIIFIGSLLLRFGLALYNRESNDPHMPVIRHIMRSNELPEKADCWECFQPKLFHYTVAKGLNLARLDGRKDGDIQKIAVQLINFFAGAATLVVMWAFIRAIPNASFTFRLLAFALLAFNPQLIGINSQATNDTFLILFCTAAIYCAYLFLKKPDVKIFLFIVFFSLLAVSTKTNGWITVVAISITLFIYSFAQKPRQVISFIYAMLYLLSVLLLSVINPLTQYVHNYNKYGSPIVHNSQRSPPLPFSNETYISYFGMTSIREGYLTFKLLKLITNPVVDLWKPTFEATHYNSLWTCIYASSQSVHFEDWPPSWRTRSETVFMINRGIYILALIPTLLILTGIIRETLAVLRALFAQNITQLEDTSFGLFILVVIGYLLFVAYYAFEYHLYTFFKAIFIYPGLLAFSAMFLRVTLPISLSPNTGRRLVPWLTGLTIALVLLYILDVVSLILQLLPNQFGLNILMERLFHIWY